GSTLGLVALILFTPRLAGLAAVSTRGRGVALAALGAHVALFAAADRGDRANHPAQVALLASVAVWALLLPWELRRFAWPPAARRWLAAMAAWGLLLVVTALLTFLPAPLARLKFTHGLVAHAHLAMAGFASAYAALLLRLAPRGAGCGAGERGTFALWQVGLAAHLAALAALAALEAADPAAILRGGAAVATLFALRWVAGAAMLVAATRWLAGAAGASA
ncbi:MAG: hypothetical protein NDJ75_09745, partial [Thermoanaerobaculia bacterium]|nr:hypothetical protein [Thermoanaerobaculia bacterium]